MKTIATAGLLVFVATFAGTAPARSEPQLPINELFPCEVVLHELIADLRKLRVAAKHTAVGLHDEDQRQQAASYNPAVQAYDEAISAATKKFDRCPWSNFVLR
jgi:hypothetical protein